MSEVKLYKPLQERYAAGGMPAFETLEAKLSDDDYKRLVLCCNQCFDAGQIEALRWRDQLKK